MWQAWALLEAEQGDPSLVRKLFRKGLEVSPRCGCGWVGGCGCCMYDMYVLLVVVYKNNIKNIKKEQIKKQ